MDEDTYDALTEAQLNELDEIYANAAQQIGADIVDLLNAVQGSELGEWAEISVTTGAAHAAVAAIKGCGAPQTSALLTVIEAVIGAYGSKSGMH